MTTEGRSFLWNRDERVFTDPSPLLQSLKGVRGQGARSGTDICSVWQFRPAWGKTQIPLCSARQNQALVNLSLSKVLAKVARLPCFRGPAPARCQVRDGALCSQQCEPERTPRLLTEEAGPELTKLRPQDSSLSNG